MKYKVKQYIFRAAPLILVCCMFFFVLSPSASAATVSYLDLDYDIAVDGENNRITVNIPKEYFLLQIRDHANNILVSSDGSDSVELWVAQGSEYRVDCYFFMNTHFSVQDLPDGSLFYIYFGTEGSSGVLNPGIFMEENWAFDKAGKEIHWYGGDLDGNRFTDTHYLYYYKPAGINASSVAFGINAQECMCIKSGNFRFNVKYCTLEFSISSFLHSQLVNQQNSNLLDEVNKQLAEQGKTMEDFLDQQTQTNDKLDDIINGEVNPEAPDGADKVGDLDDAEGQLRDEAQIGLDQGVEIQQSVLQILEEYANGFAVFSWIFGLFSKIPFFSGLLYVSLALGTVSALLGIGFSVARSSSAREAASSFRMAAQWKKGG